MIAHSKRRQPLTTQAPGVQLRVLNFHTVLRLRRKAVKDRRFVGDYIGAAWMTTNAQGLPALNHPQ